MIQQLSDRCHRDNVCRSDVISYALANFIEISAVIRTFEYSTGSEHKLCKVSALDMVPSQYPQNYKSLSQHINIDALSGGAYVTANRGRRKEQKKSTFHQSRTSTTPCRIANCTHDQHACRGSFYMYIRVRCHLAAIPYHPASHSQD
jgi:hypothetical protein